MGTLRIRLEFDDPLVLSEAQVSEGLRHSWVQLKPEHEIIFDVSSHIIHIFDLHESCPDGIVLSIDGFVLPPFESTFILKDKDVIRIGRKIETKSEEVGNLIEEEVTEKLPTSGGLLLSAGDDFEKDAGTNTSEPKVNEDNQAKDASLVCKLSDEHTNLRKRKASREPQSSKKKRKCVVPEDLVTEILSVLNERFREERSSVEKKKVSDRKKKSNRENNATRKKGSDKLEGSDGTCVSPSDMPDETKKVSSRGSRRRSEKKKWWKALTESQRELLIAAKLQRRRRQSPIKDVPNNAVEHLEEDSEEDGDLVPVVIRPGHFRFQRRGKCQGVQQSQKSTDALQLNGSTSKSGQEQGNDNSASHSRNKMKRATNVIDFDTLAPFTRLPKKGDVIAYRLLELNSTWTPELSPFRVGKTSWYNPQSHKLLLRPIPGHPISLKKKADEDECAQRSNSLYNKDGSLLIKFSSLIDVRLVKNGESNPENEVNGWFSSITVSNGATTSTISESSKDKQTQVVSPECEANPWDQNAQALSVKKATPNDWEPWGDTSSRTHLVNAWMNANSSTPLGNGHGNAGSRTQPTKGWSKASASTQPGNSWGNAGPPTQPANGWSKASGSTQSGKGRGNAGGTRTQPGSGWSKPSSGTPSRNGWGNAGPNTQPANGWSKASGGTQSGKGWGNAGGTRTQPGSGWSKPSSSTWSSSNGWGNAGPGTQPANGWGNTGSRSEAATGWGKGGSGTQPGNGWGNAGPGTQSANGGENAVSHTEAVNSWRKGSSSMQSGNGWGNADSATGQANGSENPGSHPEPANSGGNAGPGTQPANGWGNAGSGAAPANSWSKPSTGTGKG